MSGIGSFAFTGIKDLVAREKGKTEIACHLKAMVNINITDETAVDYLRGGYGNPKILTIYGDRDCKLEATTATMTAELIKLMSNNSMISKTEPRLNIETIELSEGKFTLKNTLSAGTTPVIYKIDAFGKKDGVALTVGTPATNASDYAITGKSITCHSSVPKIEVFYHSDYLVETMEAKDNTPKNYDLEFILVAKEIETGKLLKAWVHAPNATIQPSSSYQAKNETGAPDAITLSIDMLMDNAKQYPYKISFAQED